MFKEPGASSHAEIDDDLVAALATCLVLTEDMHCSETVSELADNFSSLWSTPTTTPSSTKEHASNSPTQSRFFDPDKLIDCQTRLQENLKAIEELNESMKCLYRRATALGVPIQECEILAAITSLEDEYQRGEDLSAKVELLLLEVLVAQLGAEPHLPERKTIDVQGTDS